MTWGCPKCGGTDSLVRAVAVDDDGVPVRWRQCVACDGRWGSEERQISYNAFLARRHSDKEARARRWRQLMGTCGFCGTSYRRGFYMRHCSTKRHKLSLKHPMSEQSRKRVRLNKARRYWDRRMAA